MGHQVAGCAHESHVASVRADAPVDEEVEGHLRAAGRLVHERRWIAPVVVGQVVHRDGRLCRQYRAVLQCRRDADIEGAAVPVAARDHVRPGLSVHIA